MDKGIRRPSRAVSMTIKNRTDSYQMFRLKLKNILYSFNQFPGIKKNCRIKTEIKIPHKI
jgi:hypothetical protein